MTTSSPLGTTNTQIGLYGLLREVTELNFTFKNAWLAPNAARLLSDGARHHSRYRNFNPFSRIRHELENKLARG